MEGAMISNGVNDGAIGGGLVVVESVMKVVGKKMKREEKKEK